VRSRGPGGTASKWAQRNFSYGRPALTRIVLSPVALALGGPGTLLQLRAVDDTGATLPPGAIEVRAVRGTVGPVKPDGEGVSVDYTPPPLSARVDADLLHVSMGAFEQDLKLPLRRGAFAVAANIGGRFNGGAVTSPTLDLGLIYLPGWFSRRLNAEARVGFYAVGARVDLPQGFSVDVGAQLLPISLLLAWTQPLFGLEWRLAAGFALQLAWVQLDQERSFSAVPSLDLGLGVAMPLGPGAVEARLQYLWGRLATEVRFQAGGIGVSLGYRIELPAGAGH
jgi:hypothetical protein